MNHLTQRLRVFCKLQSSLSKVACQTASYSSAPQVAEQTFQSFQGYTDMKYFTDYAVFRPHSAVKLSFILPEFRRDEKGTSIHSDGVVLIRFAKSYVEAMTVPKAGDKRYNWEDSQSVALSPTEAAMILIAKEEFKLYHDPGKNKETEGHFIKNLNIGPNDAGGLTFQLMVAGSMLQDPKPIFSVKCTAGETFVMKSLLEYGIPRILGFDKVFME